MQVVNIGAGPTGLALAPGLSRHDVRSWLLERTAQTVVTARAAGAHVRNRDVLRQYMKEPACATRSALGRGGCASPATTAVSVSGACGRGGGP
jgi:2-polyprenyl-6-methoxyphenol hydroxylase-like FAD-dependent oxidoreductase